MKLWRKYTAAEEAEDKTATDEHGSARMEDKQPVGTKPAAPRKTHEPFFMLEDHLQNRNDLVPPAVPATSSGHLAGKLKAWRAAGGLPLKAVAADLHIRESTWQRWEDGRRVPAAEHLLAVADYLLKPVCWLLNDCTAGCENCLHAQAQRQDIVAVLLPTGK